MIEAVFLRGYEHTSVKHVIGLAGVSRRAFYEQFNGKEDCFMETVDLIVRRLLRRVKTACEGASGTFRGRVRAGLQVLIEELESNPKSLHLVLIECLDSGLEGHKRLHGALAASVQLSEHAVGRTPGEPPESSALARAAVGGIRRVISGRLRDGRLTSRSELADEMLRWTLLLAAPDTSALQLRHTTHPPLPKPVQLPPGDPTSTSAHTKVLQSTINLILREPYEELSMPRIAEDAGLEIDTALKLFQSPHECLVEALDTVAAELLEAVGHPDLVSHSRQWPTAVCHATERLTAHLVANPAATVTLAARTSGAGMEIFQSMVALADEVAVLLTEGAPRHSYTTLAPELISGALSYTLNTEVIHGRTHQLDSLPEYMSYLVLAPYLGTPKAIQAIINTRPLQSPRRQLAK